METDNFKINLNQNLWGLFISLLTLGLSDHFDLKSLYWFGVILSIIASLSFVVTLTAYTINYWQNKMKNNKKK